MTVEELLAELQDRHTEGIVALTLPESSERLYLWWGDRTLCIGLAARIAHAINRELEDWEVEETETGAVCATESPSGALEPHCGQYL